MIDMRCPRCGSLDDKVVESRSNTDGASIRRRRECVSCGERFTTYETVFRETLRVKKRSGQYEEFDRRKLLGGIERACEKRPVSPEQMEAMIDQIVTELEHDHGREVSSQLIGEQVMKRLHELDEVAYVRFASVYRQFRDADEFIQEIERMGKR